MSSQAEQSMILMIMVPDSILLEQRISKLRAQSSVGSFCLKPKHSDFVTMLTAGLLSYTSHSTQSDEEVTTYVAVNSGILVKHQEKIMVSVQGAVTGRKLGELQEYIEEQFEVCDDRERLARSAIARLESDFLRRLLTLKD